MLSCFTVMTLCYYNDSFLNVYDGEAAWNETLIMRRALIPDI